MDVSDVLREAWKAVEESGVPEALQEAAFREAVALLQDPGAQRPAAAQRKDGALPTKTTRRSPTKAKTPAVDHNASSPIDVDQFFSALAEESGADEDQLREALHVGANGDRVLIAPPTRKLGDTTAQQARTVIVLLAGARHGGLGEAAVGAAGVRAECERKRCYNTRKFAGWVSGLRGFNLVGQDITCNARWVGEFKEALDQVAGSDTPAE